MTFLLRPLIIFFLLLLCWQTTVFVLQLPSYLLPSPWQVFVSLNDHFALILQHAIPTTVEMILGFILGIIWGSLFALVITFFHPLGRWFLPLLIISQAIPTFAIAPLIVIWLGYGLASKVVITILMTFFPITSALYDGLRNTSPEWLALAKTMNGKKWRVFYHIKLPAALPSLASGLRIAAVSAPIGAIIGEWVGSSQGLGYLMLNANARLQIDMMFAALIVIIILALALYFCVDKLLKHLITW